MKSYLLAARPKTLPAAVVPVWLGCVLTYRLTGDWDVRLAFYTLMGAVWIQIATNFFNDAIDSDKGADSEARIGPTRATASGQLSRRAVYASALFCLLLASLCGLPLIQERGWVMLAIGLPSFYLSYGYTGGPLPLAYKGLGELFVILFFGLLAVAGTVFVQTGLWYAEALILGLSVGCLSAVLIAINNLRDREEDRKHGKNTLAVKWGRAVSLRLLLLMALLPYGLIWSMDFSLPFLAVFIVPFVLGMWIFRMVAQTPEGPIYNKFLALSAVQLLLFAVAFQIGALYG